MFVPADTNLRCRVSFCSEWELYLPSELGYGDGGSGADIPGGAALVFTMELIKVHGKRRNVDFKRLAPVPPEHRGKKKEEVEEEEEIGFGELKVTAPKGKTKPKKKKQTDSEPPRSSLDQPTPLWQYQVPKDEP